MSGIRGIAVGVLGLTLLESILSSQQATDNTSGIIGFVSGGLARWLNPYTPLIPDLRTAAEQQADNGIPWGALVPLPLPNLPVMPGSSYAPGTSTAQPTSGTPI